MSPKQVRERVAGLLLEEVREGALGWYYISMADETTFHGGYLIEARGPTEAFCLLHALDWHTPGCSTGTTGPLSEDTLARIPRSQRWRRLDRDEALALGG